LFASGGFGAKCTTLRAMAKTYRPYVPEQDLLLPPSLRDWLPEGHLAFFVSDLVEQLDLSAILRVYEDDERGYPPYHPVMLTKVLVYGYCVGVFSSRRKQYNFTDPESRIMKGPDGFMQAYNVQVAVNELQLIVAQAVTLPKTATRVERMTRKLLTKAGAAVYARRKTMVEPVLGQIKQARGFRQFLLRGVAKVQGEWALVCTPTAHQVTLGCLASALLSTTAAPTRSSCSTCRVSRGKRSRQLKCRRQLKMELLQLLLR